MHPLCLSFKKRCKVFWLEAAVWMMAIKRNEFLNLHLINITFFKSYPQSSCPKDVHPEMDVTFINTFLKFLWKDKRINSLVKLLKYCHM